MALLHYINNEDGAFGEWDGTTSSSGGTIEQIAGAAFPERGTLGIRTTAPNACTAYAVKDVVKIEPGATTYFGFWVRPSTQPNSYWYPIHWKVGASSVLRVIGVSTGKWKLQGVWSDAGARLDSGYSDIPLTVSVDTYVVVALKRAATSGSSDGSGTIYMGGGEVASRTGVDNYDRLNGALEIWMGTTVAASSGGEVYNWDDIKIATEYPEPYVPTPTGENLTGDRIVALAPPSADGAGFAYYCTDKLSLPRANVAYLPNASTTESLADYATFQAQVEDDVALFLSRNPTVAANCTCFILGPDIPGYFTDNSEKVSATSRMMHYGTAFSAQTANSLYAPSTVARLTKTILRDAGLYLAVRLDPVEGFLDIMNAAATITALAEIPDADYMLYDGTDGQTFVDSTDGQHLRLQTTSSDGTDVAFYLHTNAQSPIDPSSGNRISFIETANSSGSPGAETLRATDTLYDQIVDNTFASGVAFSDTADGFDIDSFFEMLRIGGTFAEACMVGFQSVDWTGVPIGSPVMTVAFQDEGYNLYRTVGYLGAALSIVKRLRADDVSSFTLTGAGHAASTVYTYILRPVYNGLETPDYSCRAVFETDGAGDWLGNRPTMVERVDAEVIAAGKIRLRWSYRTPRGGTAPNDFGLYHSTTPTITPGSPNETESYTSDGSYSKDITLSDGVTYWLAITARSSDPIESYLSRIVGPLVADATAPSAPTVYTSTVFG